MKLTYDNFPGNISDDGKTYLFPTIIGKNKHGKNTFWKIFVRVFRGDTPVPIEEEWLYNEVMPETVYAIHKVESGQEGGKIRDSAATAIRAGKNRGKKNENNVFIQALVNANAKYEDKKRSTEVVPGIYPPMLASDYIEHFNMSKLKRGETLYVQRKYDGVRLITFRDSAGNVILYSRNKKPLPAADIYKDELKTLLRDDIYLDGEAYEHGTSLQKISGGIRRADDDKLPDTFKYMVYDCFIPSQPDITFSARYEILKNLFAESPQVTRIELVETFPIIVDDDIKQNISALHEKFLAEKYEGTMIRLDRKYMYSDNDYHCRELLKYKPVYDHEYEIADWETGQNGKAEGALMIVCCLRNSEGKITKLFPVTPALTINERLILTNKMTTKESNGKTHFENQWLGKYIIVYFDAKSDDNVPLRARTKLEFRKDY